MKRDSGEAEAGRKQACRATARALRCSPHATGASCPPRHEPTVQGMDPVLNRALLPGNTCFGCGLDNPAGLRIEIVRHPERPDCLQASFTPGSDLSGFPGMVHGGALFTALDCLSTWVAILLGPNREAAWVLRSASTIYHKPAPVGAPLTLVGRIQAHGGRFDPLIVRVEARRADGALCVEGEFKVVPLAPERLAGIAGLRALPDNWQAFLHAGAVPAREVAKADPGGTP